MKKNQIFGLFFIFIISACSHGPLKKSENDMQIIRSEYQPGELNQLCDTAAKTVDEKIQSVLIQKSHQRNFENTIQPIETALADFSDSIAPLAFMQYVSPHEKLRAEAAECETKSNQYMVSFFSRKDIYEAMRVVSKKQKLKNKEDARLLSEYLKEFELNGLKLSDEKRELVKLLKTRLTDLETQFSANLNNNTSFIEFTEKELEGCPQAFFDRLKKSKDGKFIVTTKQTDFKTLMENAKDEETRRRMLFSYTNIAADKNIKILEEALGIRQKIAKTMGYKTWGDYNTQEKMAKNSSNVFKFLNDLKSKLKKSNQKDLDQLLTFKKEFFPDAKGITAWDVSYYSYQLKKKNYSLDDEIIREYFPAHLVVEGMFKVYSQLLGIQFFEIKNSKTWNPDVTLYETRDTKSGEVLSYFYADFYPRPGKYGHFAAFPLLIGKQLANSYAKPVSVIVGNFNPPSSEKPSLLNHSEVEVIFHEFGHIMHQTLTRSKHAHLAGSLVARDFVEAPSQMMEEWVWKPEILNSISGHYKNPSKKLPKDLLDKMIAARNFQRGYFYTRQLSLALTDMVYHTQSGTVDTTAIFRKIFSDTSGITPIEGGHFQAGWGHLMSGYDAGYFGYLWSDVYAADMFTRFEKEGLLNSKTGADYRRTILESGNTVDAMELIKKFLGRTPNSKAFFKKLGI